MSSALETLKENGPNDVQPKSTLLKNPSDYLNLADHANPNDSNSVKKSRKYKFITKLLEILSTDDFNQAFHWSTDGNVIEIKNEQVLIEKILPLHFKLSSITNFIRQLNIYGFKKVKNYPNFAAIAYSHPLFKRDSNILVSEISRKSSRVCKTKAYTNELNTQGESKKESDSFNSPIMLSLKESRTLIKNIGSLNNDVINLEMKIENLGQAWRSLHEQNNKLLVQIHSRAGYINQIEALISLIFGTFPNNNCSTESQLGDLNNLNSSKIQQNEVESNVVYDPHLELGSAPYTEEDFANFYRLRNMFGFYGDYPFYPNIFMPQLINDNSSSDFQGAIQINAQSRNNECCHEEVEQNIEMFSKDLRFNATDSMQRDKFKPEEEFLDQLNTVCSPENNDSSAINFDSNLSSLQVMLNSTKFCPYNNKPLRKNQPNSSSMKKAKFSSFDLISPPVSNNSKIRTYGKPYRQSRNQADTIEKFK